MNKIKYAELFEIVRTTVKKAIIHDIPPTVVFMYDAAAVKFWKQQTVVFRNCYTDVYELGCPAHHNFRDALFRIDSVRKALGANLKLIANSSNLDGDSLSKAECFRVHCVTLINALDGFKEYLTETEKEEMLQSIEQNKQSILELPDSLYDKEKA